MSTRCLVNSCGSYSCLGVDLFSLEMNSEFILVNIYGPYQNREEFWNHLLSLSLLSHEQIIVGGDLNLSLGASEILGPKASPDPLAEYFINFMVQKALIDLNPIKLNPTWRNRRVGEERIAKRLDRFLIGDSIACSLSIQTRQWIAWGGEFDHNPIMHEFQRGFKKPPSPFKFNSSWISDSKFGDLVRTNWAPINSQEGTRAGLKFMENLKRIKKLTLNWAKSKKEKEDVELKEIEDWLHNSLSGDNLGLLTEESKTFLTHKEKRRKEILKDKEELWGLKSRAIWLSSGDENTKFFHAYAKGRKCQNMIWELQDDREVKASSFEDLSAMGVRHFRKLFEAQGGTSIAEVIQLSRLFPRFMDQDGNDSLMKEVSDS